MSDPLGTPTATSGGTLALDSGIPSLRKRIIRRLTTPRGGFTHLPGYGLTLRLKSLIREFNLTELEQDAETQVAQEPDVAAVRVTARQWQDSPQVVTLTVRVQTNFGTTENVSVDVGG